MSNVRSSSTAPAVPRAGEPGAPGERGRGRSALRMLSFRYIGGIYLLIAIIVIFSLWLPHTFPTVSTVKQVVDNYAIYALAALALVVPLSAGVFDISVPYTMSLCGVTAADLIADHGFSVPLAILIALLVALVVGVINGIVVAVFNIDSLIGTLATGSLIQAMNSFITGDTPINSVKLLGGFSDIAQTTFGGVTLPVIYAVVAAIAIYLLQEHTATGRRLYAVGFNRQAARLAGVRTSRLRFGSLLTSAVIAGFAGIVLSSSLGTGDPTSGNSYLLPSFAAVFLGATQLKEGRFNVGGTIIAILLLGTGITGLGLANAASWTTSMFTGVVLIAALAVTVRQRASAGASGRWSTIWRRLSPRNEPPSEEML
jgi:ribose transport system permease protein